MGRAAAPYDVVIVGGGPAGCATALSLRARAPELSVAIVESRTSWTERIGETLPPVATQLLEHLGVAKSFGEQAHRRTHGTAAAWGSGHLADNDFIYSAKGCGWHLDRAAFDAMLLREAQRLGAEVMRGLRTHSVSPDGERWVVSLAEGVTVSARTIVDATGVAAGIARRFGARPEFHDQLAGFTGFFHDAADGDERTLVEAFEDGWWYTAPLPEGRRVVACMTDADVARRIGVFEIDGWKRKLAQTTHIAQLVRDAQPPAGMFVRPARSRVLSAPCGIRWLAVGDAASSVDPLSSQGICRALRGGVFASYAIADSLVRGRRDAHDAYEDFVVAEFAQYLGARARHYDAERRWPESPFWRRRRHGTSTAAVSHHVIAAGGAPAAWTTAMPTPTGVAGPLPAARRVSIPPAPIARGSST